MKRFKIGDKVQIAIQPDVIFEIIKVNTDFSYEVAYKISEQQILHYGNISAEMLTLQEKE